MSASVACVGFATQCSIDPPRFLVCLSKQNRTYRIAGTAEVLAVRFHSPLTPWTSRQLFGGETGDRVDKFARCKWKRRTDGVPQLGRCRNRFVGNVVSVQTSGDHVAFVLEPNELPPRRGHPGEQFPFHRARRIEAGHEA